MKVHNDLSPTHNGNPIDPALVLSHDRNISDAKMKVDEASGRFRKAKQIAKTEGVDLEILKIIKTRLKHSAADNIEWLNKLIGMGRTFMVEGISAVPFQEIAPETRDEEAILRDRYELGLLHGRQGLEPEIDLMDLATPAGQEYAKGHAQGMEDYKNLQPILTTKMGEPPTVSNDDPAVHKAGAQEPAPGPKRRGRPPKSKDSAPVDAKAEAEKVFKPAVEAPPFMPDDDEFAARPVETPPAAMLN
jgi:hypothetical protein